MEKQKETMSRKKAKEGGLMVPIKKRKFDPVPRMSYEKAAACLRRRLQAGLLPGARETYQAALEACLDCIANGIERKDENGI